MSADALCCIKFQEIISKGFRVTEQSDTKIYKEVLFYINVGGIMVLVLCTLPDNALYLRQVSELQTQTVGSTLWWFVIYERA